MASLNVNAAAVPVGLTAVTIYFIALSKDAIYGYFDPDACMNLVRSWLPPVGSLIRANLLFFESSQFYRPLGSVWYRMIFAVAGFDPVPFFLCNLLIIAANTWITYAVVRRLTGSQETALLAALLISYHASFASLHFDLGMIYDVLCYFFYFSALLYYVCIRQQDRRLKCVEIIVLAVLYVCALNSKEIAVTLPAFLIAHEWVL